MRVIFSLPGLYVEGWISYEKTTQLWKLTTTMKIFVILFVTLQTCSAHLVLTFPPARKYALDFLDNFRTSAPCGVPRGRLLTPYLFSVYV